MNIEIYGITDVGNVRENNEDALLIEGDVFQKGAQYIETKQGDFFVALADGLGGKNSGELASKMCLDGLKQVDAPFTPDIFEEKVAQIHRDILTLGKENEAVKGLATTILGLFSNEEQLYSMHIGDSRLYRYRDGFLKQLTSDHSLVQVLFDNGTITKEELQNHPNKHILMQAIGDESHEEVKPEIHPLRGQFLPGDIYLLCTDGLSDMLDLIEIEDTIKSDESLQQIGKNLVTKAKEAGGKDNISIVLVRRKNN